MFINIKNEMNKVNEINQGLSTNNLKKKVFIYLHFSLESGIVFYTNNV